MSSPFPAERARVLSGPLHTSLSGGRSEPISTTPAHARSSALAAITLLLTLSGCGLVDSGSTPPPNADELRTVDLEVLNSGDLTLPFVQVTISGKGPYRFALDTGASSTVIDTDVANELGLEKTGEEREVAGVIGRQRMPVATVGQWKLDDISLDAGEVALIDLPDSPDVQGLQGLLGSDVLSSFDFVIVDYDDEQLRLPPA